MEAAQRWQTQVRILGVKSGALKICYSVFHVYVMILCAAVSYPGSILPDLFSR